MTPSQDSATKATTIINIRKLAALDLVFHGPKFILTELSFGVFFSAGLGLFLLYAGIFHIHTIYPIIFGAWLLALSLNYLPLFLYAITIVRRKSASQEVAFELAHKDTYGRKYTMQSLLLLLPLVVPLLALSQEMRKRNP